jgi:hypothetical protein
VPSAALASGCAGLTGEMTSNDGTSIERSGTAPNRRKISFSQDVTSPPPSPPAGASGNTCDATRRMSSTCSRLGQYVDSSTFVDASQLPPPSPGLANDTSSLNYLLECGAPRRPSLDQPRMLTTGLGNDDGESGWQQAATRHVGEGALLMAAPISSNVHGQSDAHGGEASCAHLLRTQAYNEQQPQPPQQQQQTVPTQPVELTTQPAEVPVDTSNRSALRRKWKPQWKASTSTSSSDSSCSATSSPATSCSAAREAAASAPSPAPPAKRGGVAAAGPCFPRAPALL